MGNLEKRLAALPPGVLASLVRGIEKEGLRASPDASLAQTPHPTVLGSALTHDLITTDFSESQLEQSNAPDFRQAVADKTAAAANADAPPKEYRAQEAHDLREHDRYMHDITFVH